MRGPVISILALVLTACTSAPKRDLDFERLQGDWRSLSSEQSRELARLEASRVEDALSAIRTTPANDRDQRAHLADIAELRIAQFNAAVATAKDQQRLQALEDESKAIMLEATRRDAELSRLEAEKLRLQSLARAEEAERMRAEVDAERLRSLEMGQQVDLAREEADSARRLADSRRREAELARMEAELANEQTRSLQLQIAQVRSSATERGQVLTLGDVFFASGQSSLKAEVRDKLKPVLDFINRYPGQLVLIEGHTDDRGSDAANQRLSEARAASVRDALVALGADAGRLNVKGLGEAQPVTGNDSAAGRARNRRVDVVIEGVR